jgi:hypothetical protein
LYNTTLYNQPLYDITPQLALWHFLLDGSYRTMSYPLNRILVIGKDTSGNPVSGADEEATELGLVGERLDFRLHPHISTAALATQVADAVLQKARLDTVDGFITLPPNCGVELWDVITVFDSMAAQPGVNFRVVGIRLVYSPRQQRYYQHFLLGAV